MKSKFFLGVFLIVNIFYQNHVFSEPFKFESSKVEILDNGNVINAYNGKATSIDNNLEINSNQFKYFKSTNILDSKGNGLAKINSKQINIKFDNAIFDQNNLNIKANGNVEIFKTDGKFIIKSDEIFYDYKTNIVSSDKITKIEDNENNIYLVDNFIYELEKNLIKVINLVSKNSNNDTFITPIAFINTITGKIFAKDVNITLGNEFDPNTINFRLKGNSGKIDRDTSEIIKGVFTTCKKREKCPPWQLSAKKIKHDKKKQVISYNHAVLKVYDVPVAYFPSFFHPDPTVKRRTGFLVPSIKNSSNSSNFLKTPFFYAIADHKDITFSPRFYSDNKLLLQSEFRQKNSNSNNIADFSLFLEKNNKNKNHFFYEFKKNFLLDNFDSNEFNLKVQSVSNDTYIKSERIESEL